MARPTLSTDDNSFLRRRLAGIAVGIVTVGILILVRSTVESVFGFNLPFSLFFISVILAAWVGGFIAGLSATAISILAYFYAGQPLASVSGAPVVIQTLIYAFDGCLISYVCASLRRESRKRGELESSEYAIQAKYKDLVDSIDHAVIWSADSSDLSFSFVSPRTTLITGYTSEEWMREPGFFLKQVPAQDQIRHFQFSWPGLNYFLTADKVQFFRAAAPS